MRHRFAIIGAKWHDKVNGNTYFNTKICDTTTGCTYYTGFEYGYGDQYVHEARDYIETVLEIKDYALFDLGSFYTKQLICKRGQF